MLYRMRLVGIVSSEKGTKKDASKIGQIALRFEATEPMSIRKLRDDESADMEYGYELSTWTSNSFGVKVGSQQRKVKEAGQDICLPSDWKGRDLEKGERQFLYYLL